MSRLRKSHRDDAPVKVLRPHTRVNKEKTQKATRKTKTNVKAKSKNPSDDPSFMDQFEHLANTDPGSGRRQKSRRPTHLKERKKLGNAVPGTFRKTRNCDFEVDPRYQYFYSAPMCSPLPTASQFLMFLFSTSLLAFLFNLPCM